MTAYVAADTATVTDTAKTNYEEQPTAETTAKFALFKEEAAPMKDVPKEVVPKEGPFLGSRVDKYFDAVLYQYTVKSVE